MFNLFSKTKKEQPITTTQVAELPPTKRQYPKVVEDIHNEFFTAGDNILQEATCLLKELETKDLAKGKRLAALGFGKTREAVAAIETENKLATTKEIADLVMYYRINYPNNKFITEGQVKMICEKYGLILGDVSMYKGFVPLDKLRQIEKFTIKEKDVLKRIWSKDTAYRNPGELINDKGQNAQQYPSIFKAVEVSEGLKICAPLKDMEITSKQILVGYKIEDKPIPDPVVLQPVKKGYLIVTAWGDEASDEIVVNEINN